MKETYELFLQGADGRDWFVALTYEPEELMSLARRTMVEQKAVSGDVCQFGRPLFSLATSPPPGGVDAE